MKWVVLLLAFCVCSVGVAGDKVSPVQKSDPVQKADLGPVQKDLGPVQKGDLGAVQKSPIQKTACAKARYIGPFALMRARILDRRAARHAARAAYLEAYHESTEFSLFLAARYR